MIRTHLNTAHLNTRVIAAILRLEPQVLIGGTVGLNAITLRNFQGARFFSCFFQNPT
jgi:hypothetical protein